MILFIVYVLGCIIGFVAVAYFIVTIPDSKDYLLIFTMVIFVGFWPITIWSLIPYDKLVKLKNLKNN